MEQADVADFHEAVRQDMREEAAEKLYDVKVSSAWAGTANFTVGERDRAVFEADDAWGGDGDPEDIGGEGGEGGVSIMNGPTMAIPGDGPDR
jgi:hypothetical protein